MCWSAPQTNRTTNSTGSLPAFRERSLRAFVIFLIDAELGAAPAEKACARQRWSRTQQFIAERGFMRVAPILNSPPSRARFRIVVIQKVVPQAPSLPWRSRCKRSSYALSAHQMARAQQKQITHQSPPNRKGFRITPQTNLIGPDPSPSRGSLDWVQPAGASEI